MSSIKAYPRGASLIEVLVVIVLISFSVSMISLVFSKATKSLSTSRQRTLANTFAETKLQELTQTSYPYLRPTGLLASGFVDPSIGLYFPYPGGTGANGCDCKKVNFSAIPAPDVYIENAITYTRQACINLVDRSGVGWVTYCPTNPMTDSVDKGLKSIRVQVSWTVGSNNYTTEMEGLVSR